MTTGISYFIRGRHGHLDDPAFLRIFYTRIWFSADKFRRKYKYHRYRFFRRRLKEVRGAVGTWLSARL